MSIIRVASHSMAVTIGHAIADISDQDEKVSFQDIAEGEGDMIKRMKIQSKDEIAELAGWFNLLLEKFQTMTRTISKNSNRVGEISDQLSN